MKFKQFFLGAVAACLLMSAPYQALADEVHAEIKNVDGTFYYYENGTVNTQKNGFVDYAGSKFLVSKGRVVTEKSGLANDVEHKNDWYYLANGQVQTQHTGLVSYDGAWFYIENGKLDTEISDFISYDGGLFFVGAGRIMKEVNGLAQDPNGTDWYYLAAGQAQTQYTGLAQYDGAWFYVIDGKLANDYTGHVNYDGSTFFVSNGMLTETKVECTMHEYLPATCTSPMVCKYCGEALNNFVNPDRHEFKSATCVKPATCSRCGKEEGEPDSSKHVFPEGATKCTICGKSICTVSGGHKPTEATCKEPSVCKICNEKLADLDYSKHIVPEGATKCTVCEEPICSLYWGDHKYKSSHEYTEATCEKGETCIYCGIESGRPLEHTTNAGTCGRCKKVVKEFLPANEMWRVGSMVGYDEDEGMYFGETQWHLTIHSVRTHNCDQCKEKCVIVSYTYGNLGFLEDCDWPGVIFSDENMKIYDEAGVEGSAYTRVCDPDIDRIQRPIAIRRNEKTKIRSATEVFILENDSDTVTIIAEHPTRRGLGMHSAKFVIPVETE